MEEWTARLITGDRLSIHLAISLLFLGLAVVFIFSLFLSRGIKNLKGRKTNKLKEKFRKKLNVILAIDIGGKDPAYRYRIKDLYNDIKYSSLSKDVLLQELITLRKNLSGESTQLVGKVYQSLGLFQVSLKKLRSWSWKKKVAGLREVSIMEYQEAWLNVFNLLDHFNSIVREEAQIALIKLSRKHPMFFLDSFDKELSAWHQMIIYDSLQLIDKSLIPSFRQWFHSPNKSVVLFSIEMTVKFQQNDAVDDLERLIHHPDREVVVKAIEALGALEAHHKSDALAVLLLGGHEDRKIEAVLKALREIGDPEGHLSTIGRFLEHPIYRIRMTAARTLRALGPRGEEYLIKMNEKKDNKLKQIVEHTGEPLLA